MPDIIVSLAYNQDYYYLPGSWWINGPARDGWDGSASYTNAGPPLNNWQDQSDGFGFSFDEGTGQATIHLPAGWTVATGTWQIECMKGPAHGTDPARPYAYYTGTITDPVILNPLIGPVAPSCGG